MVKSSLTGCGLTTVNLHEIGLCKIAPAQRSSPDQGASGGE